MEHTNLVPEPTPPLLYLVPPTLNLQKACIDNTRISVLSFIDEWMTSTKQDSPRVLWLADISGSGKSAVARHVAWRATEQRRLLCSFFFRRDIETQASTTRVISSLSREIARQSGSIASDIARTTATVRNSGYTQAFHAQITEPLQRHPPPTPCLLLIDALDEAGPPDQRADFIEALTHEIPHLPSTVKVMITSKPEQDIGEALNSLSTADSDDGAVYRLTFDVYGETNRRDLKTYIIHTFERVARLKRANGIQLPDVWPSHQQLQSLVHHANGLFLWVTTAGDYVACSPDPQRALEDLLNVRHRANPDAAIDALYRHILLAAEADLSFNLPTYHDAVDLVLASPNPITIKEINDVLRRDAGPTLACLRPVMSDHPVVRIAHQSFREYIRDAQKCDTRFLIHRGTPSHSSDGSSITSPPPIRPPLTTVGSSSSNQNFFPRFPLPSLAMIATYPHAQHAAEDVSSKIDPASFSTHPVARGAFGDIWRARYFDGMEISVKSLRQYGTLAARGRHKFERNSVRELLVWSGLNHPNVLSLLGICVFGGEIGMVSEWMPNGNVTDYAINHPEVDHLKLLGDIAAGLAYLHHENVIHGDLKGGNVVVSADGTCRLVDFGLAKLAEDSLGVSTTSTQSGTVRWMPHELINPPEGSKASITFASDIHGLGMTMLEILTGQPPFFELTNDLQVMFAIVKGTLPERPSTNAAPQLSDRVWDLINWCWSNDPINRPAASVVLDMLKLARQ